MRKTARPVVWEVVGAQSPALDLIAFVPLPEAEGAATDSPAFNRLLERAMDVLAPNMARIGGMAVRNL